MLEPRIMDAFRGMLREHLNTVRDAGGDEVAVGYSHAMIEIGALALRDLQGPRATVETLYAAGDTVLQSLPPPDLFCGAVKKKG